MADETPGTGATGSPQDSEQNSDSAPVEGTEQPESYVGTYADREAAEEGIANKDAKISELQSITDKLKAEHTAALAKATAEQVTMLAEVQKVKDSALTPSISRRQLVTDMAARIRDAEDGSNEQAVLMQELADGNMQYADARVKEETQALRDELKSLQQSVGVVTQQSNPEYLAHKDDVDKLIGKGMDYANALIAAKELATVKQPDRPTPMGSTTGNRVGTVDARMSEAEKNQIRDHMSGSVSKDQIEGVIARMEKERSNG